MRVRVRVSVSVGVGVNVSWDNRHVRDDHGDGDGVLTFQKPIRRWELKRREWRWLVLELAAGGKILSGVCSDAHSGMQLIVT